jgi:hypothetical protein
LQSPIDNVPVDALKATALLASDLCTVGQNQVTAGTKRISLEKLRNMLGLEAVKSTDGNVVQQAAFITLGELPPRSIGRRESRRLTRRRISRRAQEYVTNRLGIFGSVEDCDCR